MKTLALWKVLVVVLLVFAVGSFGAVKKKRFDVGTGVDSSPAAVEVIKTQDEPARTNFSFHMELANAQKFLREKVTAKIVAMKAGDWSAIWKFFVICLVYGMLHALGPGHGKSIVVGFFLARRGRWRQGVALGAGITFTHTLSAVLLLFILYGIFKATVFPYFEMGRGGIEKASYALLMITGLMLMGMAVVDFVKGRKKESGDVSSLPPVARWREIIGVAAVTGIVPCPAVALIVLFCLLNSMVLLALLGAVLVCIGMTFTNVLFGIAVVAFRKGVDSKSRGSRWATRIYTCSSLVGGLVIFISGMLLFSNLFAGQL